MHLGAGLDVEYSQAFKHQMPRNPQGAGQRPATRLQAGNQGFDGRPIRQARRQ